MSKIFIVIAFFFMLTRSLQAGESGLSGVDRLLKNSVGNGTVILQSEIDQHSWYEGLPDILAAWSEDYPNCGEALRIEGSAFVLHYLESSFANGSIPIDKSAASALMNQLYSVPYNQSLALVWKGIVGNKESCNAQNFYMLTVGGDLLIFESDQTK